MNVNGTHYKTVWMQNSNVHMIDQNKLPFEFDIKVLKTFQETADAIAAMTTRGAGAIGVAAAFAMAQAGVVSIGDLGYLQHARNYIEATRPTARNLFTATEFMYTKLQPFDAWRKSRDHANTFSLMELQACRSIGEHGSTLIKDGMTIQTHCNAGWLAFVDYGSALAPIYVACENGIKDLKVYVNETRPRNQGAKLTAWELAQEGIEHRIIPDSAGGLLKMRGKVDLMIVGADRIARNGDVANKIGTYLQALAAHAHGVPFFVAAPLSTFDGNCPTGDSIPIEERSPNEVLYALGANAGDPIRTRISNPTSKAENYGFDITPAKLINGYITEHGIHQAEEISDIITQVEKSKSPLRPI